MKVDPIREYLERLCGAAKDRNPSIGIVHIVNGSIFGRCLPDKIQRSCQGVRV
jgi:hypothetical protein